MNKCIKQANNPVEQLNLAQRFLLKLIQLYRLILSPWIGQQCRFYPTCSHYGEEAIRRFGAMKGSWLTLKRLLKCAPWHQGGFDPVPTKQDKLEGK